MANMTESALSRRKNQHPGENETPIARFFKQLSETAALIARETQHAPLVKRLATAFIGPIEANRLYQQTDGHYEMLHSKLAIYMERNAISHGYIALC